MVQKLEQVVLAVPQETLRTEHVFHAGMYARTIRIAPDYVLTGALIKIPTLVIVSGETDILVGDEWVAVEGYAVLPGMPWRKQAYRTRDWTTITMIFTTQAKTVDEAEREFTDDFERLMSRKSDCDVVTRTGV